MAPWNPKLGDLACEGEETWEVGVAWNCGDGIPYAASRCDMPNVSGFEAMPAGCRWFGRAPTALSAAFGAIGFALGAPGAPVFRRSSACTSMPRGVGRLDWDLDRRFGYGSYLFPRGFAPAGNFYTAALNIHRQHCDGFAADSVKIPRCA